MTKQEGDSKDSSGTIPGSSPAHQDSAVGSCEAPPDDERPRAVIRPVTEKIGESSDNLRGRGEWYGQRTGLGKRPAD